MQQLVPNQVQTHAVVQEVNATEIEAAPIEVTEGEWTYDPNEPRYCLCNQVSYGDMVACDNEEVSIVINTINLNGDIFLSW